MGLTVAEIVVMYLKENGYEGLYNIDADCGCELGDLMPCCEAADDCHAGYKGPCNCGDHDFHIGDSRPGRSE